MTKGRLEAFTDAVIAIILTVMALEFKTPDTDRWSAILNDLPYFFAFVISFLYIGAAWYNHRYLFSQIERVSKRVYWFNNLWMLSMALIPVATAWAGRFIDSRPPEYFYLLIITVWSLAYLQLSWGVYADLVKESAKRAEKVRQMAPVRFMFSWYFPVITILVVIMIYFYPPICLMVTFCELLFMMLPTSVIE